MPYINPNNTPIETHEDVEQCLQDILLAEKGEQVRGTIFDAIQLIDARSVALEQHINDEVGNIVNNAINNNGNVPIHPIIVLRSTSETTRDISSINVTYADLRGLVDNQNAKSIVSTLYDGNNRWYDVPCMLEYDSHADIITLTLIPQSGYVAYVYGIQWQGSESDPICLFAQINYQSELSPGDGIDITNGVISVSYPNGDTEVY